MVRSIAVAEIAQTIVCRSEILDIDGHRVPVTSPRRNEANRVQFEEQE
jgi:hypothetical protein